PMLGENDRLFLRAEQLLLSTLDVAKFKLPVTNYSLGIPFAKRLDSGERIRLQQETATLRGNVATKSVLEVDLETLRQLLDGKDVSCDSELRGDMIIRYRDLVVGTSLAKEGKLWNRLPRWLVQRS